MKKYLLLLFAILLLSCAKHAGGGKTTPENDQTKPLIIGGKQYYGPIAGYPDWKLCTLDDIDNIEVLVLGIDTLNIAEMKNLEGIEQLFTAKNIRSIGLYGMNLGNIDLTPLEQFGHITSLTISTWGSSRILPDIASFKSLTRLSILDTTFEDPYTLEVPPGLTGLSIGGEKLYNIDLSVVETLHDLRGIRIEGDITKLPDLTKHENLRFIAITKGALESLEGIGAPNVRSMEVSNRKELDSLAPLNNLRHLERLDFSSYGRKVYRIADMSNLPSLKWLSLAIGEGLDLQGIENLAALENLELPSSYNLEGVGALANLQSLSLSLPSPEPSLEFLRGMPNLGYLYINANENRRGYPYETEAYQVLDLSPLSTLVNLKSLYCINFIIKNISALDSLEALCNVGIDDSVLGYIDLTRSKLYDETEESRYSLIFERIRG